MASPLPSWKQVTAGLLPLAADMLIAGTSGEKQGTLSDPTPVSTLVPLDVYFSLSYPKFTSPRHTACIPTWCSNKAGHK